jgi:hypothetical protein
MVSNFHCTKDIRVTVESVKAINTMTITKHTLPPVQSVIGTTVSSTQMLLTLYIALPRPYKVNAFMGYGSHFYSFPILQYGILHFG